MPPAIINLRGGKWKEQWAGQIPDHQGPDTIDLTFGVAVEGRARHRRILAVHLQGHGPTPDSDRDFTIPHLGDGVVGFLDQLGIDRVNVWGFSLGALVAVRQRRPVRCREAAATTTGGRQPAGRG
jgi:pimeloyl-ACP methyl ester carboxylesterase